MRREDWHHICAHCTEETDESRWVDIGAVGFVFVAISGCLFVVNQLRGMGNATLNHRV